MRLTGYEIKKLMTQIPLWIAFIGLFVGNLFLLFMIQKKEAAYVYVYQQKDQYIAFCEGNEQADELGFYEADLEEQKRYLDSYREFISQMQDRSKAMENVISEGNHYLTDNIRKTCHDFSAVAKASVTVDNCFGIKALAEYQYGIFFAISFQGVLTWYLLFYERNRKLFILIKGCKNGHHVTIWSYLKEEADEIREKRENPSKLPGVHIPEEIEITTDLQGSVEGKDVIIIDDMISSGESMLDTAKELKRRKARKVFICTTFGLFTNGLKKFDEYYENGVIDRVLTTNLIYQTPELLSKPYYIDVDMSKYIALIIDNLNHDSSLSELLNPTKRINRLLERYRAGER